MIDIVYPYLHKKAKWEELRYSLRSLETNFAGKYRLVIIGDQLPDWMKTNDVLLIRHTRDEYADFTNTFDANRKMLEIINHPAISDSFICMYDDIYLLKPVTELGIRYWNSEYYYDVYQERKGNYFPKETTSSSNYQITLNRTVNALFDAGINPVYNFETHLPRYVVKNLMKSVFEEFDPVESRLQRFTLYGNYLVRIGYNSPPNRELNVRDGLKAGFYGADTNKSVASNLNSIQIACLPAMALNHDNQGLNEALKSHIAALFPTPSKYEA